MGIIVNDKRNLNTIDEVSHVVDTLLISDGNKWVGKPDNYIKLDADSAPTSDTSFSIGDETHQYLNIYSQTFTGTSTEARYADLAEKFTCEPRLEYGDVVKVLAENSEYEIGKTTKDLDNQLGVLSEYPAYLMNKELIGRSVALVGRVPVKVLGTIKKGEHIVPTIDGCIRAIKSDSEIIHSMGFALETKTETETSLIECVLK